MLDVFSSISIRDVIICGAGLVLGLLVGALLLLPSVVIL